MLMALPCIYLSIRENEKVDKLQTYLKDIKSWRTSSFFLNSDYEYNDS